MDEYRHHVSGFFAHPKEAESALAELVDRGLPRDRLKIFTNDPTAPTPMPETASKAARSDAVLKDMLVDGAVGAAVGTGIGVLAEIALVAANVSLFVASPLLAPLVLLGWGASLGGTVGAMVGAEKRSLSTLIGDAISSGQIVLVAETRTESQTALAREVIGAAVGSYRDVSTV
jgi:hypothetical protein